MNATAKGCGFDAKKAREVMLQVIAEFRTDDSGLQTSVALRRVITRLNVGPRLELQDQQALLTLWNDLFRTGQLSHGYDIDNSGPPFCHVTELGRKTLEHASRDPANPNGYLAHIASMGTLDAIASSYVAEALATYNSDCFKAAAVMIGAAAERVILLTRDRLVDGLKRHQQSVPKGLNEWQIKKVRDAITHELDKRKADMSKDLAEAYSAFWAPLTEQARATRNDAGHPVSLEPVSQDVVHATLLAFPELVGLAERLHAWIKMIFH